MSVELQPRITMFSVITSIYVAIPTDSMRYGWCTTHLTTSGHTEDEITRIDLRSDGIENGGREAQIRVVYSRKPHKIL